MRITNFLFFSALLANSAWAGFDNLDLLSTSGGPQASITWSQEANSAQWKFSIKGKVAQFIGQDTNSQLESFSIRLVDRKNDNTTLIDFTAPQARFANDADFEATISTDKAKLIPAIMNDNVFMDLELTYDVIRGTEKNHFVQLINLNKFCKTSPNNVTNPSTKETGCFTAKPTPTPQ